MKTSSRITIDLPLNMRSGKVLVVKADLLPDIAPHLAHVATFAVHRTPSWEGPDSWAVSAIELGLLVVTGYFCTRAVAIAAARAKLATVDEYLAQHGNTVLATRDKAVLSAAWNWGRQTGVTGLPNPCTGVRGKRSKDTHYVTDADLQAVSACGDVVLQDALELLYLSGANPKDMLSWRAGIPEYLEFRRAKTQLPVRIRVEGELLQLLERIAERKRREQRISPYLLVTERGERLTYAMLYDRFDKARKAAGVQFNLRQIRAKAGTDKAEAEGLEAAQAQLGHASITTTEIYVRNRRGKPTGPTR